MHSKSPAEETMYSRTRSNVMMMVVVAKVLVVVVVVLLLLVREVSDVRTLHNSNIR